MRNSVLITTIVFLLILTDTSFAQWLHWRGPNYNGSSDCKNTPGKIDLDRDLLWKTSLPGKGSGTPIVAAGKVFISSTVKGGKDLLGLCYDAETGKELWRKELSEANMKVPQNELVSPSPASDGKYVFYLFGNGDLAALDFSGNKIWSRNLVDVYGNFSVKYGYSSSPLVYGDKLIVTLLRNPKPYRQRINDIELKSYILGFDLKTGKTLYQHHRRTDATEECPDAYSSAIIWSNKGKDELIVMGGDNVTGHDPDTAKELWRYLYTPDHHPWWRLVSTPSWGEGVFIGVLPRGDDGEFAVKVDKTGLLDESNVLWRRQVKGADCSSPLYYKGAFYLIDDKRKITCLDPQSGNVNWQATVEGGGRWWSSPTAADNKIYSLKESGELVVFAADKGKFELICRVQLQGKRSYSSIAPVDGRIYVRTTEFLYCIGK